ncbi:MAG: ferritin family protein [Candidatus Sumerlaeaceae bacterium]
MLPPAKNRRTLRSLSPAELAALAIHMEQEEARLYQEYARRFRRQNRMHLAAEMESLRQEEREHETRLGEAYLAEFAGESEVPLVRRSDLSEFSELPPLPAEQAFTPNVAMARIQQSEGQAERFYRYAAAHCDGYERLKELFSELAEVEAMHQGTEHRVLAAARLDDPEVSPQKAQHTEHERFVLQIVQPGLVGLMDGSVSTLAPLFAAAFATHKSMDAFLVGVAAAVGAGISMGFAEGMSDDGALTGRGNPWIRGTITGAMTLLGGIFHTLPYLISDFNTATTWAVIVVIIELFAIAWIRNRYMQTPFWRSIVQVVFGGGIVFAAGILIGSA